MVKKIKTQDASQKKFSLEIALLDKAQSDLFNAITDKPDSNDVESMRLYIDNVYMIINKCSMIIKDVKNELLKKEANEINETYNSPA